MEIIIKILLICFVILLAHCVLDIEIKADKNDDELIAWLKFFYALILLIGALSPFIGIILLILFNL